MIFNIFRALFNKFFKIFQWSFQLGSPKVDFIWYKKLFTGYWNTYIIIAVGFVEQVYVEIQIKIILMYKKLM